MTDPSPKPIDGAEMPLPPAIFPLICVGGSYFLNKYLPLTPPSLLTAESSFSDKVAVALLVSALLLIAWAISALRSNKTTLLPHKTASTLVTSGPFSYSRNPIYLGFNLLLLAMFFSSLNLWLVILLPLNIALLQYYVILPEEKHLSDCFKTSYKDYQSNVGRWL